MLGGFRRGLLSNKVGLNSYLSRVIDDCAFERSIRYYLHYLPNSQLASTLLMISCSLTNVDLWLLNLRLVSISTEKCCQLPHMTSCNEELTVCPDSKPAGSFVHPTHYQETLACTLQNQSRQLAPRLISDHFQCRSVIISQYRCV